MREVNVYKWEPTGLHKVNGDKFGTATGSTVVLEADYDALLAERDLLLAYKGAVGDNRLCACEPGAGGFVCPPCLIWDELEARER